MLTTGNVASYCHTTVAQVNRWIKSGKLKFFKTPGGHNRISIEEFKKFLERHNIPIIEEIHQKTKKIKILVADDDTTLAKAISKALYQNYRNVEIEVVNDGYEALLKTGGFKPDLLILDIRMPKIDGLDVCRQLRNNQSYSKNLKILTVTGNTELYERDMVLANGADEFLVKPIEMNTLFKQVRKLVSIIAPLKSPKGVDHE